MQKLWKAAFLLSHGGTKTMSSTELIVYKQEQATSCKEKGRVKCESNSQAGPTGEDNKTQPDYCRRIGPTKYETKEQVVEVPQVAWEEHVRHVPRLEIQDLMQEQNITYPSLPEPPGELPYFSRSH
eukprot:6203026-Amphidinium_carterae.1